MDEAVERRARAAGSGTCNDLVSNRTEHTLAEGSRSEVLGGISEDRLPIGQHRPNPGQYAHLRRQKVGMSAFPLFEPSGIGHIACRLRYLITLLTLCVIGCDRPVYVGNRSLNGILSGDDQLSATCHVWAVSNTLSGQELFVGHASNTGFVPIQGEGAFTDVELLGKAIRTNYFGRIPVVRNGWLGDSRGEREFVARDLTTNELSRLAKVGVRVAENPYRSAQ